MPFVNNERPDCKERVELTAQSAAIQANFIFRCSSVKLVDFSEFQRF